MSLGEKAKSAHRDSTKKGFTTEITEVTEKNADKNYRATNGGSFIPTSVGRTAFLCCLCALCGNNSFEAGRGARESLKYVHFCGKLMGVDKVSNTTQRRSERHPLRLALVLLADSEQGEIREEGFTVEVSQHGCRVEGAASLSQGQLVRLLPWESPEGAIAGRVVWVGEPASNLAGEVGIEFLQPLPSMV